MSQQNMLRFDSHLIYCIDTGSNDVAKRLIQRKYQEIQDVLGLLFHRAALHDNYEIAEYLIALECDINRVDFYGKTPLMIAVEENSTDTVKVLLEANANMDFADANGKTVLQLIFCSKVEVKADIMELFLERLQRDIPNAEALVERIICAGGSMYHAAFSKDTQVLEGMLKRGIDINSRGYWGMAALHATVELDDRVTAKWLLNQNAAVDALDDEGSSPLHDAACHGRVDLLRLFLEHGANPNITEYHYDYTPLFTAFAYSFGEPDQTSFDQCIEILIQYHAIPRNSNYDRNTLFDYAVLTNSNHRINLLIARIALLEKLGMDIADSVMCYRKREHLKLNYKLDKNYKLCWNLLEVAFHRKLTMFDLLTESESELRVHVRDQELIVKIDHLNERLGSTYKYYFEQLMKRIGEAVRAAKLEDKAIPILCKLLGGNYNQCYDFARIIVGYLVTNDLEQFCRVIDLEI